MSVPFNLHRCHSSELKNLKSKFQAARRKKKLKMQVGHSFFVRSLLAGNVEDQLKMCFKHLGFMDLVYFMD